MPPNRPPSTPLLLVTGAAGKTGLAVLKHLRELDAAGPRVRALARSSRQTPALRAAGAAKTAVGDLCDPTSLARALEGADSVYHICPNVHPDEAEIGSRIIALAKAAGVRRFVLHSVLQPAIQAMPHHWAKMSVEAKLAESGLDFTVLRPAPYMQNILGQWPSIAERGVYSVPYDLATRVSMADLDDVARAATLVLTEGGHSGHSYELCAPGLLDQTEIAAVLGRALGREVRAESVDRRAWAAHSRTTGLTEHQIETLLAMFRYYERFGMTGASEDLEALLRRPPTTFARFVGRTVASGS
ncbi:MAG: NmrA family NAD(P)-binding protein [bacterium]|nr:NmrA family NAD(P)-binding protein [bacterium]